MPQASRWAVLVAIVAIAAYWPFLQLPYISDDYLQVALGRQYGPAAGWADLAADPLYRCRATSILLTWWMEQLFGALPAALNWTSLAIHVVNSWLVMGLCLHPRVSRPAAFAAAAFFAVHEGHQEAVAWFAALPELLVFFFSGVSVLAWLRYLDRRAAVWLIASVAAFVLALLSKESAAVLPAVLFLAAWTLPERAWRVRDAALATLPFAALSGAYFLASFAARGNHLHYNDGTFDLHAPFPITVAISTWRLLWIWGVLALAGLAYVGIRRHRGMIAAALTWIVLTLLPYSFLTYMNRVPSRHTYLASAALAVLVAVAGVSVAERTPHARWLPYGLAAVVAAHNIGYLWIWKYPQFAIRAEPTAQLIDLARIHAGPIHLACFPYTKDVAIYAWTIGARRPESELLFTPNGQPAFRACIEERRSR